MSLQPDIAAEIAHCRREIAEAERLLSAGHPDIHGLCLAISDWSAELRILQEGKMPPGRNQAAGEEGSCAGIRP